MQHVIRFEGGFERNFNALSRDAREYEGEDGGRHPVKPWPARVDGVRFGFMEQPGKRFVAVRVEYGDEEVVLQRPVRLDPDRHLGGKRFSAQPLTIDDAPASALFGDILESNREQQAELKAIRDRVRRDREKKTPA